MADRYVLTPSFLETPLPGLDSLLQPDWHRVEPNALLSTEERINLPALHEALAASVANVARAGDRPVSIAGDCCSTIGVLAGLQRAGIDPTLLWFDAHGDFNTWETTPSGFLGGMPLAMLVGRGEQRLLEAVAARPLAEERVILTDARDLDPGEKRQLESSRVVHLRSVNDLPAIDLPDGALWIHFDTDVLDPAFAPAQNYPVPGGATPEELERVFRHLASTGNVRAVSVSTWNPELDADGATRELCMRLLPSLLGR